MYCFKCGKQIDDQSKFCRFCGVAIPGAVHEASRQPGVPTKNTEEDIDKQIHQLDEIYALLKETYEEAADNLKELSKEDVYRMHKAGFVTDEQAKEALNSIDVLETIVSLYPQSIVDNRKRKAALLLQTSTQSVNSNAAQEESFAPAEAKVSPVLPTKARQPLTETNSTPTVESTIEQGLYMAGAGPQKTNEQQLPTKQDAKQVDKKKKLPYKERLAQCNQSMGWFKALPYLLWGTFLLSHFVNFGISGMANMSDIPMFAAPGYILVIMACHNLHQFKASGFGWSYAVFIIGAVLNIVNAMIIAQYIEFLLLSLGLVVLNIFLFIVTWRFYQKRENLFDSSWS